MLAHSALDDGAVEEVGLVAGPQRHRVAEHEVGEVAFGVVAVLDELVRLGGVLPVDLPRLEAERDRAGAGFRRDFRESARRTGGRVRARRSSDALPRE